jgi:cytosine/adenosine deaminase-related metal-dependent hydrolase
MLLLRNVRPMGGAQADILIENGRIARIEPDIECSGAAIENGEGRIAIPGLVDAHTHLDKSMLGMPWYRNEVGPRLIDRIENERNVKTRLGLDPARQARRQILQSVAYGTTHFRSHVDIDTAQGLEGIEGVLAAKESLRDIADIELVAFPQSGLLIREGTADLMRRALDLGVEVVGGLDPAAIDRDPKGHLDTIFALADRYGRAVDIHLHEPDELGAFSMELIMERTQALSMQGRVTVSHAFCLGMADAGRVDHLIERLARLNVHIVTTGPASVAAPPVIKLRSAGVTVAGGNDGIRDAWGPYGTGDMLERAMFIGLRNNFRRDDELGIALDVCTEGGATVMQIDGYGLNEGSEASLVVLEGETLAEAIVNHGPRPLVIKKGRVVARRGQVVERLH